MTNVKMKLRETASHNRIEDIKAEDYSENMFRDGNNPVSSIGNKRSYDAAAHSSEVLEDAFDDSDIDKILLDRNLDVAGDSTPETLLDLKKDTTRSRDGTDASGSLDESGGFLGGTTQEVDDLEATGAPVDKIPHMND